MVNPKASYPKGTTFETRIHQNEHAKETVGEYVVGRFLGPGQSAFISDGSSTFFVGLLLFAEKIVGFRLYTNSLPIAHEYPLWETKDWPKDFTLDVAGGIVNPTLMMTGHRACEEVEKRMANRAQWTILSIRFIFGDRGPAGWEPDSLEIKQAALRAPQRVILIADHSKLSQEWADNIPLVYAEPSEWQALMKCPTTYVVTTLPLGKTVDEMRELGRTLQTSKRKPTKPMERYAQNTWPLRFELGNKFIELECS